MEYILVFLIGTICGGFIVFIFNRRSNADKLALLEDARSKLSDAFKALSSDALKDNNTQFLQLAQTNLETFQKDAKADLNARQTAINNLVEPLKKSLKTVD